MSTTDCRHGMPSAASCVECMEEGPVMPPRKKEKATVLARFPARYPGQCPYCDLPIYVNQWLAKLTNGATVHRDCGMTARTLTYACGVCDRTERHPYDRRWPLRRCGEHGPMTVIDAGGAATTADDHTLRVALVLLLVLAAAFVLGLAVFG